MPGTAPPDVVELWDWTLSPGDRHSSEAHTRGTKELLQVQQGTITLEVAEQSITPEAGDAISFPGDVAHAYANPGDTVAAGEAVIEHPDAGTTPGPGA